MNRLTLFQQQYLNAAELFLWGEALDFTEWFIGERVRWKRTEYTLPRLVERKELRAVQSGKKLVYTASKKSSTRHICHGLTCTKALLRFKSSKEGDYIPESYFRRYGYKAIPEWGIVYPNSTLLFEYATADNFRRTKAMNQKIQIYRKELVRFRQVFKTPFYLIVIDAPRYEVQWFSEKLDENFFVVYKQSFFEAEKGKQLTESIYIWGGDGKSIPLESRNGQTDRTSLGKTQIPPRTESS